MLSHPDLDHMKHKVYFDEGLFDKAICGLAAVDNLGLPELYNLNLYLHPTVRNYGEARQTGWAQCI